MFERLRSAIKSFTQAIAERTLSEEEVDKILWKLEMELLESDVALEVAHELVDKVKREVVGVRIGRHTSSTEYLKKYLMDTILNIFLQTQPPDLIDLIQKKKAKGEPYVIIFLGVNGTGKTTTIAKLAYILKKKDFTTVLACADTYRAGAIEQLSEHAKRLSVKIITQKYGADPAAVARDAVLYAKTHRIDVVLIDTAGRMQTSRNLMEEMRKIIRVVNPDLKLFVGDALAGNDMVSQAREFQNFTGFDASILTKVDADVKGGAA
ncbi:MAG: signal recognition particle-docking protein FtsY, partial [Nitrososphaerota archaeon]|nr:signal recognition particle-docking protein FtsY [Nitrososphaerota archaeon]